MKELALSLLSKANSAVRQQVGPGLPSSTIAAYNVARGKPTSSHVCHAPFSNMYFNVHGDCAPCWLTFFDPDSYPAKSLHEIWFGEKFQNLRQSLQRFDLTHKCNVCLKNLQTGNYTSLLARAYDVNPVAKYPAMMELELGNTCNLECVMCIGELSSSIRKNREKLPALRSPYDEAFVMQLEEFIPHLKELRFNGGEPFLIGIVYKIFEKVERLNPKLKIVIATNGTVLNNKVREWLGKLNIHINFSLDSLTPSIYETIRVNAKFSRTMEHFEYFHGYCQENNRTFCLMVNPMRNNWHEMPNFIRFVNEKKVNIWFNTIHRPVEWAIWSLPSSELEIVYTTLSSSLHQYPESAVGLEKYNLNIFRNLVEVQIKNWWKESEQREETTQVSLSQADNSSAQSLVIKNLTSFVYLHFNESEDQKKQRISELISKLDSVNNLLQQRNGDVQFFLLIMDTPSDVLYTRLETAEVKRLVEDFETHVLQRNALN